MSKQLCISIGYSVSDSSLQAFQSPGIGQALSGLINTKPSSANKKDWCDLITYWVIHLTYCLSQRDFLFCLFIVTLFIIDRLRQILVRFCGGHVLCINLFKWDINYSKCWMLLSHFLFARYDHDIQNNFKSSCSLRCFSSQRLRCLFIIFSRNVFTVTFGLTNRLKSLKILYFQNNSLVKSSYYTREIV